MDPVSSGETLETTILSLGPLLFVSCSPHSLFKSCVCFLCEILDYHSSLPIMGSAHSLVLRLILLLSFFEFSYARPRTHLHEHLHSHSLVRKRVDSLICRNPVSYVLYRDVPEGSSSQFIRLIAQVTDSIWQPLRLFSQDPAGRECSRL